MSRHAASPWLLVTPALALALVACLPRTVVGVDDVGGAGGSAPGVSTSHSVGNGTSNAVTSVSAVTTGTSQGEGGAGTGGGPATAIALMTAELPPDAQPCGFTACTPPSDTLFLAIDSDGNSCQNPLGTVNTQFTNWRLLLGLPPQYQAVGSYTLADPAVYFDSTIAESGSASATGQTSGALGGGYGTIDVLSIDKTQITFRIMGTNGGIDEDGVYTAPRCTPLP
jgi:hypothetical protein